MFPVICFLSLELRSPDKPLATAYRDSIIRAERLVAMINREETEISVEYILI